MDANRFDGPIVDTLMASQTFKLGYIRAAYERPNFFLRTFWTRLDQPSAITVNPRIANFFSVTDRNGSSQQSVESNSYDLEAQHALEFGTAHRLTYGVNYRHNDVSSNFLDGFSQEDRLGIYIQEEWHATQALTVVAGLRYDLHSEISPPLSPRFALLYRLTQDHTLRVAVAVASRPPTIFETRLEAFGNVTLPFLPFPITTVLRGSRALDPERIVSYDVGYQGWFFRHRLRLRADLFFNHISDLISNQSSASGGPPQFVNGGEADIYGGEVGGEFLFTPWLSGFVSVAAQEIGQTLSQEVRRGAPQFKVNAGLRGEWGNGLSGEASIHYVGAATYPISEAFSAFANLPGGVPPPGTRVGHYTLLNLRTAYRFWNEKAEVAVTVFNALNDRHKEHPLGDTIGRRVMGWVTINY